MSLYITAQLVGFLGFLLLSSAPYLKTKDNNVRVEIVACIFLALQWHMLAQPSLVVINVINITLSIGALSVKDSKLIDKSLPLFYPISLLAILWFSKGTVVDALALIGVFSLITSKRAKDMRTFRSQAMLACLAFTSSGILAQSIPAVIFGVIRFSLHSYRLSEITWQTKPPFAYIPIFKHKILRTH